MKFIYHYHATTQMSRSETVHINGILTCDSEINTMDRYHEARKAIAGEEYFPEDLVIDSLSFLHSLD